MNTNQTIWQGTPYIRVPCGCTDYKIYSTHFTPGLCIVLDQIKHRTGYKLLSTHSS